MQWKEAEFKGKKIWVQVDQKGMQLIQQGRSPIRYSKGKGAKVYSATASNIVITGSESTVLDAGELKESSSKNTSSGFGSAKTRTKAQKQNAKKAAQELVASFEKDAIICFTDGACKGNPGRAACGVYLQFPDGSEIKHGRYLGEATNNIAELTAILDSLNLIAEKGTPDDIHIEICTDSKYVQGVLSLNWKAKSNQELVKTIKQRIKNRGNIRLHWVAGHAGIEANEIADQLAVEAIEAQ